MPTTQSLATRAWISVVVLMLIMGLLIFVSAGTLNYWQAWLFLAVIGLGSALSTAYLLANDPALLERRMRGGPTAEQRKSQVIVMWFVSLGFIALLVVPAIAFRTGRGLVSSGITLIGDLLVIAGFYFIIIVFRENSYAAATIQVEEGQKVISSGPYSIVRHPMYSGALLYLAGTPLALGSWYGFIGFAFVLAGLIWRIFDEETLLVSSLSGYADYRSKVRYRLIPGIW